MAPEKLKAQTRLELSRAKKRLSKNEGTLDTKLYDAKLFVLAASLMPDHYKNNGNRLALERAGELLTDYEPLELVEGLKKAKEGGLLYRLLHQHALENVRSELSEINPAYRTAREGIDTLEYVERLMIGNIPHRKAVGF